MATLRNKRKLAAMARETQEYPRNNQSQNSAAPGITEDNIAKVSEEIEGRVTKKLSQEFGNSESRILDALSKLDEYLLNPQIRTISGTVPGTFRNANVENQEPNADRSQNDPHPEVEFFACRASNLTDSDPDETSHIVQRDMEKIATSGLKSEDILYFSLFNYYPKSSCSKCSDLMFFRFSAICRTCGETKILFGKFLTCILRRTLKFKKFSGTRFQKYFSPTSCCVAVILCSLSCPEKRNMWSTTIQGVLQPAEYYTSTVQTFHSKYFDFWFEILIFFRLPKLS